MDTLPNKSLPWSYSKLSCWNACHKQYFYRYIAGIRGDTSPAAQRGIELHSLCEEFVNGKCEESVFLRNLVKARVAIMGSTIVPFIIAIRQTAEEDPGSVMTELKVKVNSQYLPYGDPTSTCHWHYGTVIYDVLIEDSDGAEIIDYKTGKIYDEPHYIQAALYANTYYRMSHPNVMPLVTFVYLDLGVTKSYEFTYEDMQDAQAYIHDSLKEINAEQEFNETEDKTKCRWCSYRTMCRGMPR